MSLSARQRFAIVVPQHRAWSWHQTLITTLRSSSDVDVYTSADAPVYPLLLRLWMRLEGQLLGELDLVKIAPISIRPCRDVVNGNYSLILNLSEAKIPNVSAPVLEPRFDGFADSLRLFTALLNRKSPYISIHFAGREEPSVGSYLAIQDKTVLIRGLQVSFARLLVLIYRAVQHAAQGSCAAVPPRPGKFSQELRTTTISRFIARFFLEKLLIRHIRRFQLEEHWSVGLLWSSKWEIPNGVALHQFAILPDDRRRCYADPFVFTNEGQKWLFVEELDYKTGKGVISCTQVINGEKTASPRPVLVRPYHLSYPFIFRHGDQIYMLPETGSNRTVELYRSRSFPFDWVLCRVLMKDIELYDSTLLWHKDKWWIFGAVAINGGSSQDELAIFFSEHLEGPWRPHRMNPVKSDCRSARPAGKIIMCGDRLLRPAQDCEDGYGAALVWLEIEELTTERFREREVARWPGSAVFEADGLHTFNWDQGLGVIDIRRKLWKRARCRTAALS